MSLKIRDILSHCVGIHRAYSEIYQKPEYFVKIKEYCLFKNGGKLFFRALLSISSEDEHLKDIINTGISVFKYDGSECEIPTINANGSISWSKKKEHLDYEIKETGIYYYQSINLKGGNLTNSSYEELSELIRKNGIWYLIGVDGYTLYLSKCTNNNFKYSQESIIYTFMFFLGSITRYNPHLFDTLFSSKEQWLVSEFLKTQPKQFLYLVTAHVLGQQVLQAKSNF